MSAPAEPVRLLRIPTEDTSAYTAQPHGVDDPAGPLIIVDEDSRLASDVSPEFRDPAEAAAHLEVCAAHAIQRALVPEDSRPLRPTLSDARKQAIATAAADFLFRRVQQPIGQPAGDVAARFFSGAEEARFRAIITDLIDRYLAAEQAHAPPPESQHEPSTPHGRGARQCRPRGRARSGRRPRQGMAAARFRRDGGDQRRQ
jgi:hypothetical protein